MNTQQNNLDNNFLRMQRKRLNEKLDEYREINKKARVDIQFEQFSDFADEAVFIHQQALAFKNLADSAEAISQILLALDAMDKGKYGKCHDCEGFISNNRLQAIPGAIRCVNCQEEFARVAGERYGDGQPKNYRYVSRSADQSSASFVIRRTKNGRACCILLY